MLIASLSIHIRKGHQVPQQQQQKHHPKSKQSIPSQYGGQQSNKMKVHHEMDSRSANQQQQQQPQTLAHTQEQQQQHANSQFVDSVQSTKNVAQNQKNAVQTAAVSKSHSQSQQSNKAINIEPVTQTAVPSTNATGNVASTDESKKSDLQKNLLGNNNKQTENTSSSSRTNEPPTSALPSQEQQQQPISTTTVSEPKDEQVNIASAVPSNVEPIVDTSNSSTVNVTSINPDSASSNKSKSATNTNPDETDKAAENILDSNSNIKNNLNSNIKKPSLPNSLPPSTSSTSKQQQQQVHPSNQTITTSSLEQPQQTERVESESAEKASEAPAADNENVSAMMASVTTSSSKTATEADESTTTNIESTPPQTSPLSKSNTDSNVNTKESSNHISNDNEASIDNGLAETINNIKNNNLTNSTTTTPTSATTPATSATNKMNNNIVDKDLDNNPVNDTEEQLSTEQQQQKFKQPQQIGRNASGNVPQTQLQAPLPNNVAAQPAKTLLNYEEGQWSPDNTDGKKQYNRQQLVSLRNATASLSSPLIQDSDQFQLIRKTNTNFPANANNNNNKNQSSSANNRNQYNKRPSTQGAGGNNQQMSQGGGKGSKSGMIHVSLSLREDVKLNESANAWKPSFLGSNGAANIVVAPVFQGDLNNIEVLCKRVRGILNKLTPEKFDPLLEQLQALNIDSAEKLSSVISLVFEKAIDEPNFSAAYSKLCQKLSKPFEDKKAIDDKSSKDSTQAVFKKELLNKCQTEFDNHVANENSIRSKLLPIQTELNETNDMNRKMELNAQLEEEERKLRRRSVGTVRFIGELYRQNMLLTSIMEWCIVALLNIRTEEKLECLCKLLTTVGQKMEDKTGDSEYDKKYYRDLTPHFQTMHQIASDKKSAKISSRVRFMLMDVIELRKNKWVPRRVDANPKKMGQIQKEAEQEQYKNQIAMLASMSNNSGMGNNNMRGKDNRDRNDRGNMRNDSRGNSMSGSGYMNSNNNNKSSRGGYQDTDGWIQQGSNKGRGGNSSIIVDPTKFRASSVCMNKITIYFLIKVLIEFLF